MRTFIQTDSGIADARPNQEILGEIGLLVQKFAHGLTQLDRPGSGQAFYHVQEFSAEAEDLQQSPHLEDIAGCICRSWRKCIVGIDTSKVSPIHADLKGNELTLTFMTPNYECAELHINTRPSPQNRAVWVCTMKTDDFSELGWLAQAAKRICEGCFWNHIPEGTIYRPEAAQEELEEKVPVGQ